MKGEKYMGIPGRPRVEAPDQFTKYYQAWKDGEITAVWFYTRLGLCKSTFYRRVEEYEAALAQEQSHAHETVEPPAPETQMAAQTPDHNEPPMKPKEPEPRAAAPKPDKDEALQKLRRRYGKAQVSA